GDYDHADPAWSPDGRTLAFTSARHDERDHDDVSDIWLVSAEGSPPHRVTGTDRPAAHPAFSPSKDAIAYLGRATRNAFGRNIRLFTVPAKSGASECRTDALDRSCEPLRIA